jgi:hypothetical protein|tara:strand:+ start:917 stop:1039 length:123 start_codon:yes stop_codon:yes gene_type:complete
VAPINETKKGTSKQKSLEKDFTIPKKNPQKLKDRSINVKM